MTENNKKKRVPEITSIRWKWWLLLIALGSLVFCGAFFLVTFREKNTITTEAKQMLAYLQTTCSKYDDYELGNTTKDLQAVLNKANSLRRYTGTEGLTDEDTLLKYAQYQYLTGIVVLDENCRVAGGVDISGGSFRSLLRVILLGKNVRDILQEPRKSYMEQVQVDDRYYNYAIVARTDQKGVIICYTDITESLGDRYTLSLASLLLDDTFRHDAVTVVTDGQRVEGANIAELQGMSVVDWPVRDVSAQDEEQNGSQGEQLVRLRIDGENWYGMHTQYRSHYLYVFYPAQSVFENRTAYMSYVVIGYFLLAILGMLWFQRRRKERIQYLEKEFHLTSAIARIYSANLLLHLRDNTWQPVVASDRLRDALQGAETAMEMLKKFRNSQVMEEYREGFARFTDINTMEGRLKGKNFEGYFFEHVNRNWYQALLIPLSQFTEEGESIETVMLVFRDATQQRKKELDYQEQLRETARDAECANAAKTDFLRRMSHDIRTPINGIRGMADIGLSVEGNPEKAKDCFSKIISASNFLLELVNNVLDMSKLESGEIQLEEKAFDLRELVRDAALSVETQAAEQGLTFTMEELEPEAHWQVIGSPLHIRQILQNIMSNAVKYNRENGSVHISCHEVSCEGGQAVFEFSCADTGIGMSEEFQKHAFELFAQEHKKNEARTTFSGTGLGLPIAKKIADCIGADLSFTSEEGVGTTFVLKLYLKIDARQPQEALEPATEATLEGMCILVVEDNELNMEIVEYMLQEKGVTVIKARNGKIAFELFRASEPGTFDMILMDIMMPVMDGLEATRQIRALQRPDAATVPILAMSANAFTDDVVRSLEAGMNDHLSKPLEFRKMMEIIAKYRR